MFVFPGKIHPGHAVENASEEEGGLPVEAPNICMGSGSGCRKAFDDKVKGVPNLPDSPTL